MIARTDDELSADTMAGPTADRAGSAKAGWFGALPSLPSGLIIAGLLLLGLLSRAAARPASLWEWDDIDFARAIHDFNITAHRPHPPGFPVFVALAKMAWLALRDDQAALFAVNYLFASFLGVILYLLLTEIMPDHRIALGGAILGSFAPTLWVHSGIARTDNPSLVIGLATLWLLLRGRRSNGALLSAGLLLGLGMGIRVTIVPLTGLVLALVLLGRLRRGEWRLALAVVGVILAGVAIWLIPLIRLTGWDEYQRLMQVQSAYINEHDPIWSRYWRLDERFHGYFVRIWGAPWIMWTIYTAAGGGIFSLLRQRHWRSVAWMGAAFIPFLAFTVIYNTPMGVVVYSMPYIPFFTSLAAAGILSIGRRIQSSLGGAAILALAVGMGWWSYPMVELLRREPSPPIRAAQYLRERFDPGQDRLYFDELLLPHATYFFDDSRIEEWRRDESLSLNLIDPDQRSARRTYLLSTEPVPGQPRLHFHWPDGAGVRQLRPLSIGRYFDIYLTELDSARNVGWGAGWYGFESAGLQNWRWMGQTGNINLFNEADRMRLRISGRLPKEVGRLTIRFEGRELARFDGPEIDLNILAEPPAGRLWSGLTLTTDRTFSPKTVGSGQDARELGFQCFSLSWEKEAGAVKRKLTAEQFLGAGWGELLIGRPRSWRWAGARATVRIPARPADGRLRMIFIAPALPGSQGRTVQVSLNGVMIDSFTPEPDKIMTRDWNIPGAGGELVFESSQTSGAGDAGAFRVTSLGLVEEPD